MYFAQRLHQRSWECGGKKNKWLQAKARWRELCFDVSVTYSFVYRRSERLRREARNKHDYGVSITIGDVSTRFWRPSCHTELQLMEVVKAVWCVEDPKIQWWSDQAKGSNKGHRWRTVARYRESHGLTQSVKNLASMVHHTMRSSWLKQFQ